MLSLFYAGGLPRGQAPLGGGSLGYIRSLPIRVEPTRTLTFKNNFEVRGGAYRLVGVPLEQHAAQPRKIKIGRPSGRLPFHPPFPLGGRRIPKFRCVWQDFERVTRPKRPWFPTFRRESEAESLSTARWAVRRKRKGLAQGTFYRPRLTPFLLLTTIAIASYNGVGGQSVQLIIM